MRIALLQMTSGIDPATNAACIVRAVHRAAEGGAEMLFTPEMSGLLDRDRDRAASNIVAPQDDPVLAAVRAAAAEAGIYVAIGSLAVRRPDGEAGDGRYANRAFVIGRDGAILATYDKIHMFDVSLATGESWRESAAYAPGDRVVTVDLPLGRGDAEGEDTASVRLGLAICYDIRFPALFEELGRRKCDIIAVPAAFTRPTGAAHWHVMQRARAIEASAFVVSAAQAGCHADGRETYGHSLVVDPWGEVLLDMGPDGDPDGEVMAFADLDLERIATLRRQLPSLANRRNIPRS